MDLRLAFITALLMALAAVLVRAVFGKKVAWAVGAIGALALLLPLVLIIAAGVTGMLQTQPGAADDVSSGTVSAIVKYVAEYLPDLAISAVAGAIVGLLLSLLKKVTPRKVKTKVRRAVRL
jgi:hypothetical protein